MSRKIEMSTTELRNNLGSFVEELEQGTTILITKRGRRLATVAPIIELQEESIFGCMKGRLQILSSDLNLDPQDYGQLHWEGESVDIAD